MDVNEHTIATYDNIAKGFFEKRKSDDNFFLEEFNLFVKTARGKKVIDLGCGTGRGANLFLENGFDYAGIDASRGMLELAKSRFATANFLQMDFYGLNFPSSTFDCFWAANSLLHVPKSKINQVLDSIGGILKAGGVGFISLKPKGDMSEGFIEDDLYGEKISRYFAFYGEDEFSKVLEASNFSVLDVHEKVHPEFGGYYLCFLVEKGV